MQLHHSGPCSVALIVAELVSFGNGQEVFDGRVALQAATEGQFTTAIETSRAGRWWRS